MALSKSRLKDDITAKIEANVGFLADMSDGDKDKMRDGWDKLAQAIADAVIDEITANAAVSTTVTGVTGKILFRQ